jgi:hypothetical protein
MSLKPKEQEEYHKTYWTVIEKNIDDTEKFIRDYLSYKKNTYIKKERLLQEFKNYEKNNIEEGKEARKDILADLKTISVLYNKIINVNLDVKNKNINNLLRYIIAVESTIVYIMNIVDDFNAAKKYIKSENDLLECFKLLYSFIVRRKIGYNSNSGLSNYYPTLHNKIIETLENKNQYSYIQILGHELNVMGMPNNAYFKERILEEENFYKKKYTKTLLIELENKFSINKAINYNDVTIEHIAPQTMNKQYSYDLTQEEHNIWVNKLANLTLTNNNSESSNKPFKEKKDIYTKEASIYKNLYADIMNKEIWNVDALKQRGERLAEELVNLLPYAERINNLNSSNTNSISLNDLLINKDNNNVLSKKSKYINYEYDNEEFLCDSFTDFYFKLISQIVKKYNFTEYDFNEFKTIFITKNNINPNRASRVLNEDYNVSTNLSSTEKIKCLERIIDDKNIDPNLIMLNFEENYDNDDNDEED